MPYVISEFIISYKLIVLVNMFYFAMFGIIIDRFLQIRLNINYIWTILEQGHIKESLAGLLCYVKCYVCHLFDNYGIKSTTQLEYENTWNLSKVCKAYLRCYFCDCCIFSSFLHFQKNIFDPEKTRIHKEKCSQQTSNFTSKIFTSYTSTFLDHYCFHIVSDNSWCNTDILIFLLNSASRYIPNFNNCFV